MELTWQDLYSGNSLHDLSSVSDGDASPKVLEGKGPALKTRGMLCGLNSRHGAREEDKASGSWQYDDSQKPR